jgi:phage/plasmid-associated DNA primase
VCVFGPKQKIGKKELFEAWEQWCYENGEEPGKQNSFTRLMGDKGVVLNFEEVKVKGNRIWKGIGVGESAPQTPSDEKVPPLQKSRKNGGRPTSGGHFSEDSAKVSEDAPREERFSENGEKVPPGAKSAPQVVTTPSRGSLRTG